MQTVAFCEIEPYCQAVLNKHWPDVPCFSDVTKLKGVDVGNVDVICGGFPCQDISAAGKGAGITGERSGLWKEFARLIGEIRPKYAIIENVPTLRSRGLSVVLSDLAAIGYDAEWHCIPASFIGARHRRDRIWIVANSTQQPEREQATEANPFPDGWEARHELSSGGQYVPVASGPRLPLSEQDAILSTRRWEEGRTATQRGWWAIEPNVGRVANGVSSRVDRLKSLGNAVVPQIPEIIGKAILEFEKIHIAK